MNQIIIELKLSVDHKQRAFQILDLLQKVLDGSKEDGTNVALILELRGHVMLGSATVRDRQEGE